MKAVYKLHFDCGRQGVLDGLFIAEKEEIKWLIESKLEVHFGEVLGKHSEIYDKIEDSDITLVSDDEKVIDLIKEHDLENGFNPLGYTLLGTEELLGDKFEDDLCGYEVYKKLFPKD